MDMFNTHINIVACTHTGGNFERLFVKLHWEIILYVSTHSLKEEKEKKKKILN